MADTNFVVFSLALKFNFRLLEHRNIATMEILDVRYDLIQSLVPCIAL